MAEKGMKRVQNTTFRPHGQDDVAAEAFASSDLVGNLQGDLDGDQVSTTARPPEPRPRMGGPQEVLVLDVHEPAGFADGGDVGVLNGEVHDLALRCRQHKTQPMLTSLFGSALFNRPLLQSESTARTVMLWLKQLNDTYARSHKAN